MADVKTNTNSNTTTSKASIAGMLGEAILIGVGVPLLGAVAFSIIGVIVAKKFNPDAKYLLGIGGFVLGMNAGSIASRYMLKSYGDKLNKSLNKGSIDVKNTTTPTVNTPSITTPTKTDDVTSSPTNTETDSSDDNSNDGNN